MLNIKRQNLIKKGHPDGKAMVNVIEWRGIVQGKLTIDRFKMQKIENELIQKGYLTYTSTLSSWLVEGDGQQLPIKESYINNDCLHDGTARGFYIWLDGKDTIH